MRNSLLTAVALVLSVSSNVTWACATCLCGDPTITTMGTEKPFAGRMRAGVEYLSRSEKTAQPGLSELVTEEQRVTYSFSYAFNSDWMFAASLPTVTKSFSRFDSSTAQGSGMGDMDFSARWFLGKDSRFPARYLWGMQLGLRAPTSTEQKNNGVALDIDAQPGVGATVPSVGIWYGRYALPWFLYTSASVQHAIADGIQGYRAGDAALTTVMTQYAFKNRVAVQLSLDGRFKRHDKYVGIQDNDSGGVLVMATPGLAWTPYEDFVVNMSYQIPVIENSNGRQEEDATLRVGVAYDF